MRKTIEKDNVLITEVRKITTGATVHKVNNLLQNYMGFIEIFNTQGKYFEKVDEMERKLRVFLFEQRMLTFGGGSV